MSQHHNGLTDSDQLTSFVTYAAAFEEGFARDDWKVVDVLMTDEIVWTLAGLPAPIGGAHSGRNAVVDAITKSVDSFDRRFDLREPRVTAGPTVIPGGVHLGWEVTYRREGLPPFVLLGEEWDLFHDGKLDLHCERIHNAAELGAYLARYDAQLLPAR